jgi:hypothetical protein
MTRVIDRVTTTNPSEAAPASSRDVAVVETIKDLGPSASSAGPFATVLLDAAGQTYQLDAATLGGVAQCHTMGALIHIGPGESGSGCVVFQIPTSATVAKIQFQPPGGFIEWLVP